MIRTIFIAGIHGTGKTTLGKELAKTLNYPFDSSSNIIKRFAETNWDSQKRVENIVLNQNALIDGIKHFYSEDETILLDGHFTLLDKNNKITKLPKQTFEDLNIKSIILCTANPRIIVERLISRDTNNNITIEEILLFQESEKVMRHILPVN